MNQSPPDFLYHLFPLGALGAEPFNPGGISPVPRLRALQDWVPHWQALGVDTILLGPVFDSETHGYDTRDLKRVDPRLGSWEDLKGLISSLREKGFKVVLDGVFNHTGRSFPVFRELLETGGQTSKASWYKDIRPGVPGWSGAGFSYRGWNGHGSLPELNLSCREVRDYLLACVGIWMDELVIDGLRLDAADVLDFDFMKELSRFCREKKPDFWLLGEVIHGDYSRWIHQAELSSVTNYELYKSLWSSLKDRNFFELTWTLSRQFGPQGLCRDFVPLTFLDNHDVSRLASVLPSSELRDLVWQLSFFLPGIPSVYYGSEWDWEGVKGSGSDWNLRPPCRPGDQYGLPSRVTLLRNLGDLRRRFSVFRSGTLEVLGNSHSQLAFVRRGPGAVLVLANSTDDWASWGAKTGLSLGSQIWGPETAQPDSGAGFLRLPPFSVLAYILD